MCGIAGVVQFPAGPVSRQTIQTLLNGLEHRGPDDGGWLEFRAGEAILRRLPPDDCVAEVVFAHRRLSILDTSDAGWQPMSSADGRFHIAFNGEIYNYLELRQDLERIGVRFRSQSDTEVLLEAWAHWGVETLQRAVGMFAFAMLDARERKLLLARDFAGIKPLFYSMSGERLVFGSEINLLMQAFGLDRTSNAAGVHDYLRFGLTDRGTETMFRAVKRVPAGGFVKLAIDRPASLEEGRYFSVDLNETCDISLEAAAKQLRELFLESVRLHVRSDVAIGANLSGGIDSSSIVVAMRRVLGDAAEIHTISYVPDDPLISEQRWIDIVVRATRVKVSTVRLHAGDLAVDFEDLIRTQGEPFSTAGIYPEYAVYRFAKQLGIKVMLGGQGADELLGGYRYYLGARVASLVRRRDIVAALQLVRASATLPGHGLPTTVMQAADHLVPFEAQAALRRVVGRELTPRWVRKEWFESRGVIPTSPTRMSGNSTLRALLWDTLTRTSIPRQLRYEDRDSMRFGVESRVPFLTPAIVRFVLALPEEYIIGPDGTSKRVFRMAMRGLVPDPILDRRDKLGFPAPENAWLCANAPLVESALRSHSLPFLRAQHTEALLNDVRRGSSRAATSVWRIVNLVGWTNALGVQYA